MKILVIGKGKMGNFIYNSLKEKYQNEKKMVIDNVTFDKEKLSKKDYDLIIDFSHPDSINYYKMLLNQRTKIIIGTTNFTKEQEEYLEFLSKMNPVVKDVNFSKGLILVKDILNNIKNKISNYEVKIIETHHESKIDSPSGTTKELNKIIKCNTIETIRNNELTSSHEIVISNNFESLNIKHKVFDKESFISGVFESIKFLSKQKSGLYSYQDVVNWN